MDSLTGRKIYAWRGATSRWKAYSGAGTEWGQQTKARSGSYLGARIQEVITETNVGLEQVGLDPTGGLDGHLGAILENGHREVVAW